MQTNIPMDQKQKIGIFVLLLIFFGHLNSAEAIKESNRGEVKNYDNYTIQQIYENGVQSEDGLNYQKALYFYNLVTERQKFKRLVDPDFQADLYYHMSLSYLKAGEDLYFNYGDQDYYKKSLAAAEKCLGIKPHYWQAFENMAIVYSKMKDLDQADFYYTEAEKFLDHDSADYKRLIKRHEMVLRVSRMMKKKAMKAATAAANDSASTQ